MIEAVLLGSGGTKANPKRFCPSNLIWINDEPVLIDCGPGTVFRLREADTPASEITRLLLTHLHIDHYADYPYFLIEPLIAWGKEAIQRRKDLVVYGPPGTSRLLNLFEKTYDVEMDNYASLKGYEQTRELMGAKVTEISEEWELRLGSWVIRAMMVDHGLCKLPCFAYRIDVGGKSIVFSGDTVPCDSMIELAKGADVLVHECTFPDEELEARRRSGFAYWIHSTPSGVAKVAQKADVKKLVINHLTGWNAFSAQNEPYDWETIAPPVINEKFDGEVIVSHDLMHINF